MRQFIAVFIIIDNQTFHITQRNCMCDQCQCIQEFLMLFLCSVDIKSNHAGILFAHKLYSSVMLGMAFQTRIPYETNRRIAFQELCNLHSNTAVLCHTQGQSHQTTGNQPCIEGAEDAAEVYHGDFLYLCQELLSAQNTATQGIAVTVDIFCHAVDFQICTQFQRVDGNGACKGGIYGNKATCGVCSLGNGFESLMPVVGLQGVST